MKLRSIVAAVALAVSGAAHALPSFSSSLGTDPDNAIVLGGVFFGSSASTYSFSLSTLSDLEGTLYSLGKITISSIVVKSTTSSFIDTITLPASNSGSFLFSDLAAGKYTLTFNSTGKLGVFGGKVSAVAATVPEPDTYALVLAGLGAIGIMARRRQVL